MLYRRLTWALTVKLLSEVNAVELTDEKSTLNQVPSGNKP